jgi:nicotinamide-nucleotide amidase
LTGPPAGYGGQVQRDPTIDPGLAARVSALARRRGVTVAVAESLTGGHVSVALAAAEAAGEWYRGALVAYSREVKHDVLGVPDGPVVSGEAAIAMARGVRRLLTADVAVGVTGSGGPDPQDEQEPGTVYLAVDDGAESEVRRLRLDEDVSDVLAAAVVQALVMLADRLAAQ